MPCVSKPDKNGYVSMGNAADGMPVISTQTELVIAEINPGAVRTRRQCETYFGIRLYCGGTVILSNIRAIDDSEGQQGDLPGNRRISFRAGRGRGNDRSGTGTAEFLPP